MRVDLDEIDNSILKERAKLLAKPLDEEDTNVEEVSLLEFRMMGARYSITLTPI